MITWVIMLDLRSLTYLVTLAERLNFARAAEDIGISQPALTRAIQSLERQLGMRLFDRDRSGVSPTPQGRTFIERAQVLVANARDLERQAVSTAAGQFGRVRFGIAPLPARVLLAGALTERIANAPELTNDIVVRNVEALLPMLMAGEIEFFLSAEGQVDPSVPLRAEVLGSFPYGLVVRKGHPLLSGACPEMRFPVLLSNANTGGLPDAVRSRMHGQPHVIEDFETLSAITSSTDAIWICSPFAVQKERQSGSLCELSLDGPPPPAMRIFMYMLDMRTQSPAARAFKEAFRKRIRDSGKERA